MKQKYITILIAILTNLSILTTQAQIQWASRVEGYSTNFNYDKNPKAFAADQVLGEPELLISLTAPKGCVWTPSTQNAGEEWIKVSFAKQQLTSQVIICELFNLGAISEVIVYKKTADKKGTTIYQNDSPTKRTTLKPFSIILDKPQLVQAVKIILRTDKVSGYNTIDAIGISSNNNAFEVKINLPENLQSMEPEALTSLNNDDRQLNPIVSPDGKTLYYTTEYTSGEQEKDQDIWQAQLGEDGEYHNPIKLGKPLNYDEFHSSILSITPDGQTALVLNVYLPDGKITTGVSISRKGKNGWGFPEKQIIDDFENLSKYGEYFLSNDQKILLSTVERSDPGAFGNKDVYVSFSTGKNTWSKPKNLGAQINSSMSEISPFLASDGVTLYFATEGKPGYGGADLFKSTRLDDTWQNWSKPVNLGPDINTPEFDAFYTLTAAGDYAYFSANHNIYRIKLEQELRPEPVVLVKGFVKDIENNSPIGSTVKYVNLDTREEVGIANSDQIDGTYEIVLPYGALYGVYAEADGYYSLQDSLDLLAVQKYKEVAHDLLMSPVKVGAKVTLNNVFFYQSKSKLIESSYTELDRLVTLLSENENLHIQINGHTDNIGNKELNLKLSEERAEVIKDFLIEKGISKKRLSSKGFGGSVPVGDNRYESGRKQNRRVEFEIVKL